MGLLRCGLLLLVGCCLSSGLTFPKHSWDHLPVFLHGSQEKTDSTGAFSPGALPFINRFPIVTIEKWQGCEADGPYLYEEDAWVAAAKAIKTYNSSTTVIVWLDSMRIYTANKTLNPDLNRQCTTGHFRPAEFLETHPDYLLHNKTGQPALEKWSHCHLYDFTRPEPIAYWRDMCINMTKTGVIDGCGADASWQGDFLPNGQPRDPGTPAGNSLTPEAAKAWDIGHRQAMRETTAILEPQGGLLLGKMPWELGAHVNGAIHEGCSSNNDTINTLRNLTALNKATGRKLVYECHASCSPHDNSCKNSVAAFLCGAGDWHYWGLGGWSQAGSDFSSHWIDDLMGPPLGKPLSDAQYDHHTSSWRREFAAGTNVTFNAKTGRGDIQWAKQ